MYFYIPNSWWKVSVEVGFNACSFKLVLSFVFIFASHQSQTGSTSVTCCWLPQKIAFESGQKWNSLLKRICYNWLHVTDVFDLQMLISMVSFFIYIYLTCNKLLYLWFYLLCKCQLSSYQLKFCFIFLYQSNAYLLYFFTGKF